MKYRATGAGFLIIISIVLLVTCEKPERILKFETLEAVSTDISSAAATLKGEVTDLGSKPIEEHGLLLSESSVPSFGQQNTFEKPLGELKAKKVFQAQFTGLKSNTTYYFRAYVVVDGTPELGSIKNFTTKDSEAPTVTAGTVSEITMTTALLGGEVTSDGGESTTIRGILWSTSANPTIATALDTTVNGSGVGTFTGRMTGLTAGTRYYARTYAKNSKGTVYNSTDVVFKTHNLPVVTTTPVSDITTTGASSGGEVTDDGGVAVTARGICWSTTTGPTVALTTKTSDGTGEGVFTSTISGLSSGTTYYVKAYATNQYGTSYGAELSFTAGTTTMPPSATTSSATPVGTTTATLNGSVNANGLSTTVTFEYGTTTAYGQAATATQSPVTGSSATPVSAAVTGLSPSTTYHFKVKAVSTGGTSYGNDVAFTTTSTLPTVNDYDGNTYNIVTIGTQEWMQKNLMVTHYSNGDVIPNITDNATWGGLTTAAYSWYNNDVATYKETYGALYNWYVVSDIRNVCPAGWHVPTDEEWTTLSTYLGGETVAGGKLKEAGLTHWITPNTGATNETGFTALPAGERESDGNNFSALGYSNFLWSATLWDTGYGWARFIPNSLENISRSYYNNKYGYSIRCLKGAIPLTQTDPATAVASTSVTLNGKVNPNGLSTTVTIEYGTSTAYGSSITPVQSPASGTAPVDVSANLTSLTAGITYHYRIKAVNSAGTSYSTNMSFVTPDRISDTDGNFYNTVIIGTQTWMQENLKTTKYNDNNPIPLVTGNSVWSNLTTPGYCWFNNDEATYKATYGALYNWYAVNTGKLCPTGWHVPTEAEWTILTTFLGGESVASGKLKEAGTSHWSSPNTGATNESGFTFLPGGFRNSVGDFFCCFGQVGHCWSASETDATNAMIYFLYWSNSILYKSPEVKVFGASVRCSKD